MKASITSSSRGYERPQSAEVPVKRRRYFENPAEDQQGNIAGFPFELRLRIVEYLVYHGGSPTNLFVSCQAFEAITRNPSLFLRKAEQIYKSRFTQGILRQTYEVYKRRLIWGGEKQPATMIKAVIENFQKIISARGIELQNTLMSAPITQALELIPAIFLFGDANFLIKELNKAEINLARIAVERFKTDSGLGYPLAVYFMQAALLLGEKETLKEAIDAIGININAQNQQSQGLLHWAASAGFVETIYFLVEKGAKIDIKNSYQETPLHWAAESGSPTAIETLINLNAEKEATTSRGETPLCLAATLRNVEALKILIEKTLGSTTLSETLNSLLRYAAAEGHTEVLQLLIDKGAQIDTEDNDGKTALIHAVQHNHPEAVALLIKRGAEVNIGAEIQCVPLLQSALYGFVEILKHLLEAGADKQAIDYHGRTALHLVAREGHADTVRLLLDSGADIEARDVDGSTALHQAALHGQPEAFRLLVQRGADIHTQNNLGGTPLEYAYHSSHFGLLVLREYYWLGREIPCVII